MSISICELFKPFTSDHNNESSRNDWYRASVIVDNFCLCISGRHTHKGELYLSAIINHCHTNETIDEECFLYSEAGFEAALSWIDRRCTQLINNDTDETDIMTFEEAVSVVEHYTTHNDAGIPVKFTNRISKAMSMVLQAAKAQFNAYNALFNSGKLIHIQNERGKELAKITFRGSHLAESTNSTVTDCDANTIDGVAYDTYRISINTSYDALDNISDDKLLEEVRIRMQK